MKRGILFVTFVAATGLVRSADAEQLIVNSYGGPYEDIIRDRIIEPFEKEFGVKVIYDAVGSASQDPSYGPTACCPSYYRRSSLMFYVGQSGWKTLLRNDKWGIKMSQRPSLS